MNFNQHCIYFIDDIASPFKDLSKTNNNKDKGDESFFERKEES